jgi:outer membrane murein-binding lipoprotein Lpp
MMNKFKLTVLAASLGLAPLAHADTNADILNELQALKAKVQQLEAQVKEQQSQITENQKATDEASKVANHADVQVSGIKAETESSGFKGLKITGMIAPAYVYNQDQQASSFVFLNRSNASAGGSTLYNYDNSYFGSAYISFAKETEGGTKWTLTLAPDRGAGTLMNGNSIIHEASVSLPLNGDKNTRLIAGQIPDWEGYESTWPNQGPAITHNLLFDFAELTAYTGVGVDVTRGNWEWKTMLANVNSPRYYYNNNYGGRAPAAVFRADYSVPGYDNADIGFWGLVGKLPNAANLTGTSSAAMFEVDGYLTQGAWGYYGQLGYGQQSQAAYNGDTARWYGLSGMLTYNFTPRVLSFARFDYLNDSRNGGGLPGGVSGPDGINGFGPDPATCTPSASGLTACTGNGANRYALSLGLNYIYTKSTTFKVEYRYDRANLASFSNVSDGSYKKDNNLLAASVVVSF